MTASAKRRTARRAAVDQAAGRCCSRVVCGCPTPEPGGPSPDRRTLEEKLRAATWPPPRQRPRQR